MYYRLDRKNKVAIPCSPCEGPLQFGTDRVVRQDTLPGGVFVSTVFIVLDHAVFNEEPLLFETMVFDDYDYRETRRYSTWAEAEQGHSEVVTSILAKYPTL